MRSLLQLYANESGLVAAVCKVAAARNGSEPDGSNRFIKAYLSLLNMVAANYKHAAVAPKMVHVCGGSLNGLDPCGDIQKAIKVRGLRTVTLSQHGDEPVRHVHLVGCRAHRLALQLGAHARLFSR